MVQKASVYTKTGDQGKTGLVGGTRVLKSDPQIELYGEVDELNSHIGLACSFLVESGLDHSLVAQLHVIQAKLFDLGSNLACEPEKREKFSLPQVGEADIHTLEEGMDYMDSKLPKLEQFILPGGCRESSALHICRTVCRRLERKMIMAPDLPVFSLQYINRLSDYFFMSARYLNLTDKYKEITWSS